jgi:hypothetical protein
LATTKEDIDDLLEVANTVLPQAGLPPELTARIRKDAAALATDIKQAIPEPGATAGLHFLTEQGIEGYQYDFGEHPHFDGSQPLGLLNHLGGQPILAVVGRGRHSPGDYDLLVKWLTVGWGYVRDLAVPQMSSRDREQFETFLGLVTPLLRRLDAANREKLIPALADGQVALVVDAKLRSRQFIKALPPTEQPMPMIEPALLLGVSDARLLLEGFEEYWAVLKEIPEVVRQMEPGAIPEDYEIPDPTVTTTEAGQVFEFPLPRSWGVDSRIVPNVGLGKSLAAFSISRSHTLRLLHASPAKPGGVLAEIDRPRATAATFDFAGLIDAATPWIDLAVEAINEEWGAGDETIGEQVHTVLEVLKVLRRVTSESYFEGDALVTHSLLEIRDVE